MPKCDMCGAVNCTLPECDDQRKAENEWARDYEAIGKAINRMDFDHPFIVDENGNVTDAPSDVYAPSVYNDDANDVLVDGAGWDMLTGLTGQYGYHGAVMHQSEFIGSGIACLMVEMAIDAECPQTFVVVIVMDDDRGDDGYSDDIVGWAIAHLVNGE